MSFSHKSPSVLCRLVVDRPASGAWNMAVDEALLEWSERTGGTCLRLYRWTPATLSLGYFQEADSRRLHASSLGCPLVRRASGGGAIVHDRELTYSLVAPLDGPVGRDRLALYRHAHMALIDALAAFGLAGELWTGAGSDRATGCGSGSESPQAGCQASDRAQGETSPSFLCFARRTPGDLVMRPEPASHFKVAGSAQRRSRSALLQHGSILFERSDAAPELPGILDLAPDSPSTDAITDAWLESLAARLGLRWEGSTLAPEETQRAEAIAASKYAADAWTLRRGRA